LPLPLLSFFASTRSHPLAGTSANDQFDEKGPLRAYALRDHSDGEVAFETALPASLEGKVPPKEFEDTIVGINRYFEQATDFTWGLWFRNCLSCATFFWFDCCVTNPYAALMVEMSEYVRAKNKDVFNPCGLVLVNPLDRGLRLIEITELVDGGGRGGGGGGAASSRSGQRFADG